METTTNGGEPLLMEVCLKAVFHIALQQPYNSTTRVGVDYNCNHN